MIAPHHMAFAAGLLGLAFLTGLAMAGWLDHGAALFLTLAEAGLAMCM